MKKENTPNWIEIRSIFEMGEKNSNFQKHSLLLDELKETYQSKNKAYGDSFGDTYKEYGIISALTRITDKFNRFKFLVLNDQFKSGDESIIDTLMDMANYCLMTVMEIQQTDENKSHS